MSLSLNSDPTGTLPGFVRHLSVPKLTSTDRQISVVFDKTNVAILSGVKPLTVAVIRVPAGDPIAGVVEIGRIGFNIIPPV